MKKLLFTVGLGLFGMSAFAQLPVSTAVENKNVVLEEFTGIRCVFCPDGHKRANDFKVANPGDVVLINIHTGSFATPGPNDPDFTTSFGAAIAGQSGLTGYPAGTVNRRLFSGSSQGSGSAQNRSTWATTGATVIGESSYVNVALEADVDLATSIMTIDVEMYFTGSTAPSEVLLNVVLMQNNIAGPQTGGATYYPAQILPDGQYNHQHMLRTMFTGQWGDTVKTTAMGTLITRTYTYNVPADINGVPLNLGDLELAAFITETRQDIITGSYGPVTFTAPVGSSIVDLGLTEKTIAPTSLCDDKLTPAVELKNNSALAVDSVEVSYTLNSNAAVKQWFTGNLAANGTATVTFPQISIPQGTNSIRYQLSLNGVSKFFDLSNNNNIASKGQLYLLSSTVNPVFDGQGFEELALAAVPANGIINDETGRLFAVNKNITNPPLTTDIGGWGSSSTSLRFDFAGMVAGPVVSYITEKFDFSASTSAEVEFDYAYALRGTTLGDEFAVYYSKDCGANWVEVWRKASADLATTSATAANARFYPQQSTDWTFAEIIIPAINGESEVIFKIEGTSAGGNALYFDNFNKAGTAIVSLNEASALQGVSLFPNPANEFINISIDNSDVELFNVEIINAVGQVVYTQDFNNMQKLISVNTENFESGMYIVKVSGDNKIAKQRVAIVK